MSSQLLTRVKQFLSTLEPLQDAMLKLFDAKRLAVTAARADEMLRLAETESALTKRMQETLSLREEILVQATHEGLASESIQKLVASLDGDESVQLQPRIRSARKKSETIRRESWVQWVVSQRAMVHYNELLDLIAHCGNQAPTYSERPNQEASGGAILDASI